MELSAWVCKDLARAYPRARIGWVGRKKRSESEIDPGDFVLVELLPWFIVGRLDSPMLPDELWDYTMGINAYGAPEMQRISRGRLWNAKGGLTADWDPLALVPVYVAKFEDYGIPNSAIPQNILCQRKYAGGRTLIEEWRRPMRERIAETAKEAGQSLDAELKDLVAEEVDKLWSVAQNSDAGTALTTREERVELQRRAVEGEGDRTTFEDYYAGRSIKGY